MVAGRWSRFFGFDQVFREVDQAVEFGVRHARRFLNQLQSCLGARIIAIAQAALGIFQAIGREAQAGLFL